MKLLFFFSAQANDQTFAKFPLVLFMWLFIYPYDPYDNQTVSSHPLKHPCDISARWYNYQKGLSQIMFDFLSNTQNPKVTESKTLEPNECCTGLSS